VTSIQNFEQNLAFFNALGQAPDPGKRRLKAEVKCAGLTLEEARKAMDE